MDCGECKVKKTLHINTEKTKICEECIMSHGFLRKSEIDLKNDVLAFIRKNAERAGRVPSIKFCEATYGELEVTDTKVYLLSLVSEKLKVKNNALLKEVMKSRIGL